MVVPAPTRREAEPVDFLVGDDQVAAELDTDVLHLAAAVVGVEISRIGQAELGARIRIALVGAGISRCFVGASNGRLADQHDAAPGSTRDELVRRGGEHDRRVLAADGVELRALGHEQRASVGLGRAFDQRTRVDRQRVARLDEPTARERPGGVGGQMVGRDVAVGVMGDLFDAIFPIGVDVTSRGLVGFARSTSIGRCRAGLAAYRGRVSGSRPSRRRRRSARRRYHSRPCRWLHRPPYRRGRRRRSGSPGYHRRCRRPRPPR